MADLITLAEAKAYLGLDSTAYDTRLSALITDVSAAVEDYLDRSPLLVADVDEVYNGRGRRFLKLRAFPVVSLTSVTFDYDTSDPTVVDGSQFLYDSTGTLRFKPDAANWCPFYEGFQNIRVIYRAGYASLPAGLALGVKQALAAVWNASQRDGSLSEERLDKYAYKLREPGSIGFDPLLGEAARSLAPYRSLTL